MSALLFLAQQQITPTIVKVVPAAPTKEISVVDIIVGGLGLTGLILLFALIVGGALGALFIWFKNLRPQNPLNGQASQTHGLQLTTNLSRMSQQSEAASTSRPQA